MLVKIVKQTPEYIMEAIRYKTNKVHDIKLPKKIGKYSYFQKLGKKSYPFGVGLYKDKKGTRVVAKIFTGSSNSIYYTSLLHEANVLEILTKVQERVQSDSKFEFPSFIKLLKLENSLVLVTKYVEGKKLSDLKNEAVSKEKYQQALKFLTEIGENLTKEEKKVIPTKKKVHFLKVYPFIFLISLIKQPSHAREVLSGAKEIIKLITGKSRDNISLVHGDLHLENIIVSKTKNYIFDLEQIMLTYKEYELIASLSCTKNPKWFDTYLTNEIKNKKTSLTKALIANCSTHNLTSNMNKVAIDKYINVLNLSKKI